MGGPLQSSDYGIAGCWPRVLAAHWNHRRGQARKTHPQPVRRRVPRLLRLLHQRPRAVCEADLRPEPLTIMPSTFHPDKEAAFLVTVATTEPLRGEGDDAMQLL